ncbi:MAG: DNA methylase [Lachnospiraceae bacterium]|nr:DNA methylase [Butyrivibrio sp.]MCM1343553.1 DNA methylase [Muribaculaceae bacterium]MCM1410584.1 DNA methylase [Lachnospiraceae bacterium]
MSERQHTYIAIDLKSFYASVECVERGLDPLTTNLVVADASRTEKTICLAVSPSLKAYGIPGRARLFEVVQRVKEVNAERRSKAPGRRFAGSSCFAPELREHPELEASYIVATPRMAFYLKHSTVIYNIYLKYIAPEDIHVYSIDEVLLDVTQYLGTYRMTARELASKIIKDVLDTTGMTATAGIGTNLYLCKVAMDIVAKHVAPDENGVRIAQLDEMSYRQQLWSHRPLTDFWRVGQGYRKRLEEAGLFTMGDIARCSLGRDKDYHNEELLYKLFGVNAELLIDHAWGWEPVTMDQIKAYRPETNCISSGQVLHCPYDFASARLIVREMADLLALDLVEKRMVTDQMALTVGYDIDNLADPGIRNSYRGEVTTDRYGRRIPKHAHGTANLDCQTSSAKIITDAVMGLYDRIVDPKLLVRRVTLAANHLVDESEARGMEHFEQMELFTDHEALAREKEAREAELEKERRLQEALLSVKKKYGKNAILKGMDLQEGATTMERNRQIGGHKA